MDRSDGRITDAAIARAEVDADRLAFELLAPESDVLPRVERIPERERREAVEALLQERYGLPATPATHYATLLVPESSPSFVRRLWAVR
jgi:hypothetical protein